MKTIQQIRAECHDLIYECMSYKLPKYVVYIMFAKRMGLPLSEAHISKMVTMDDATRALKTLKRMRLKLEKKHRRKTGFDDGNNNLYPLSLEKLRELRRARGIERMLENNRRMQEEAAKRRAEKGLPPKRKLKDLTLPLEQQKEAIRKMLGQ